jgi:hypothetical protein
MQGNSVLKPMAVLLWRKLEFQVDIISLICDPPILASLGDRRLALLAFRVWEKARYLLRNDYHATGGAASCLSATDRGW